MIYINEEDVLRLADPADLILEMERAFADPDEMPSRLHCDLPGSDGAKLLVMPAWQRREVLGVKVAAVMPENGGRGRPTIDGLYVLLDGLTGQPRAVIAASALTLVRTAAVSGLAAQYLARHNTKTLLMVGTGALATHLVRSHASVRSYQKVLVWGRDLSKASAVVGKLQHTIESIEVISDLADGIKQADVISAATAAPLPLIMGSLVRPGTHVDLVGSFTPDMREADSALFSQGRLVVDTIDAFEESGDLIVPAADGIIQPGITSSLSDLVRTRSLRRKGTREITVFKAVGTGLADIAAASRLYALQLALGSKPQKLQSLQSPQNATSRRNRL